MASYLSYFTSTSSQPYAQSQQYGNSQQAASTTWTGTFSSRIATLRKALTKDNEEDDPDNEDCSHVSNVLRAYYTEKGRTLPPWLPPDPKKPAVIPPPAQSNYSQYGNMYGNQYGNNMAHGRGNSGGRGGLSDLWDNGPAPTPQPQAQSLRAPRPTPQSLRSDTLSRPASNEMYTTQQNTSARPLPSQRTGSYQSAAAAAQNVPVVGSRDRLRARLQGGGSGRSSPALGGQQTSYHDPGGYDRGSNVPTDKPYTSASQPWSNDGDQFSSYNPGYDSASGGYGNTAYRQRPGGPR